MPDDLIDAYMDLKMEEVTTLRQSTHPVEFQMSYSCLLGTRSVRTAEESAAGSALFSFRSRT